MPCSIEWLMSEEMRRQIEPFFLRALHFLPPWTQSLTVRYDPTESDPCTIGVHSEYRMAHVQIGDSWFAETEPNKLKDFVHEIAHLHTGGLSAAFKALLESTTEEDSPLRKWANEQWRLAEEACVSDWSETMTPLVRIFGEERV